MEPPRRYFACRFDDKEKGERVECRLIDLKNGYCRSRLGTVPHVPAPHGNIFVTIWAKLGNKSCAYLLIVNI
jgi:hypothetical protein